MCKRLYLHVRFYKWIYQFDLHNNDRYYDTVLCASPSLETVFDEIHWLYGTGLSKKMDGIWNRYNLKSTGRIYTFGVLKCSEKFKVLDLF